MNKIAKKRGIKTKSSRLSIAGSLYDNDKHLGKLNIKNSAINHPIKEGIDNISSISNQVKNACPQIPKNKKVRFCIHRNSDENVILDKESLVKYLIYLKPVLSAQISAISSWVALEKAIKDFGFNKNNYYIKGNQIVFKGYAAKRFYINAPKYLLENSKVVNLGIGLKGKLKSIKGGFIISIVIILADNSKLIIDGEILKFISKTLVDLCGSAISEICSAIVASITGALIASVTLTILTAIVVGTGVALLLEYIKDKEKYHKKVEEKIIEEIKKIDNYIYEIKVIFEYYNSMEFVLDMLRINL